MTRNTQFLINVLLTLAAYFALCAAVIAVTHSGYCRCGTCEDCKLRLGSGDEETTMTQATVSTTTIWPRVALFNYFAVPMPPLQPDEVVNRWYQINTRPSFGRSGFDWV